MKSIVSIQDMTEEFSSEKIMTNNEEVTETVASVLVPSPSRNDVKDEGQPMNSSATKEDEVNRETPTGEKTPINGSIMGDMEDKSNDATDENSNTDVNSNVEATREEQNGTDAASSGDGSDASDPQREKVEEATTKESTTESASESTNPNEDTMCSGDGNDDFVNAIEEQLEKVVQEEEAVTKQAEDEPIDDRPESEKVVSFVMDALFGSAMEQVATKATYDEALSKLNAISQSNRRLLDEDLPGNFDLSFSFTNEK